ncbi:potassium transporter TrkA [Actinomadura barringtoniae]|uniref:Potassium transporter TrkA n=1 Tax=Actinomadura barringtoniae TaxID=1427535 RepID=A0A939PHL6_9ACTN|nr:potassium transporter TrkA [Actinomadura barringtoniae]MBO2449939.1 potassium transporter TrkA [Actinomadura barringtoniae]
MNRIRYRFDNLMARGMPAMIGLLVTVTLLLVAAGGGLLIYGPHAGRAPTLFQAMWTAFMHALDPGALGNDGPGPSLVIVLLVTLGGLFIVSALVAVVGAGVDNRLAHLRKGRSTVAERGHTVVLGWSEQIFTIISELTEANLSQGGGCVTVLAAKDKVEMEDALRERVGRGKRLRRTRVVCRTGDPIDPADLAITNPRDARSVIVLPPTGDDPDSQVIKSLLALSQLLRGGHRKRGGPSPHVVATIADRQNLAAARLAGGSAASLIDTGDFISRMMVQTSLQSGLSAVYQELLDFAGDEIYMREQPELVGRPYGEALPAYRDCAVMGVCTAAKQILLNPPMNRLLEPGDQLILIAEDDDLIELGENPRPPVDESAISLADRAAPAPKRVLMLGWHVRATAMVIELDAYVSAGSVLDVVSDHRDMKSDIVMLGERLSSLTVEAIEGDAARRETLESLDLGSYDHIIVLCSDEMDTQRADSRVLVTLLHLRDISSRNARPFTLVTEMGDDRNRVLAGVVHPDDFIVSEKLITLRMAQVSENRHLEAVFNDLFDPDGSEIYLKPAGDYVLPGAQVDFYTVVEAARRRGETAIGYRLQTGVQTPPLYGVSLNPDKAEKLTFTASDRIIVVAED